MGCREALKRGAADQAAGDGRYASWPVGLTAQECLEGVDFGALGGERIGEASGVSADGDLMSAVPVARCGDHLTFGLQAASVLMEALEIIAGRAVDQEDVGLRALGDEVEGAVVGSDAEIEEGVEEPHLVF